MARNNAGGLGLGSEQPKRQSCESTGAGSVAGVALVARPTLNEMARVRAEHGDVQAFGWRLAHASGLLGAFPHPRNRGTSVEEQGMGIGTRMLVDQGVARSAWTCARAARVVGLLCILIWPESRGRDMRGLTAIALGLLLGASALHAGCADGIDSSVLTGGNIPTGSVPALITPQADPTGRPAQVAFISACAKAYGIAHDAMKLRAAYLSYEARRSGMLQVARLSKSTMLPTLRLHLSTAVDNRHTARASTGMWSESSLDAFRRDTLRSGRRRSSRHSTRKPFGAG